MATSIILEGPNGAGKSTLAEQLSEQLGWPIMHATKPVGCRDAINRSLNQQLGTYPVIYDRSHAISRLVYQNESIGELERALLITCAEYAANTHIIIYCIGKGERDINKPHYNDKLIKETSDQEKIRKLYDKIMSTIPHQKYNFVKNKISDLQLT